MKNLTLFCLAAVASATEMHISVSMDATLSIIEKFSGGGEENDFIYFTDVDETIMTPSVAFNDEYESTTQFYQKMKANPNCDSEKFNAIYTLFGEDYYSSDEVLVEGAKTQAALRTIQKLMPVVAITSRDPHDVHNDEFVKSLQTLTGPNTLEPIGWSGVESFGENNEWTLTVANNILFVSGSYVRKDLAILKFLEVHSKKFHDSRIARHYWNGSHVDTPHGLFARAPRFFLQDNSLHKLKPCVFQNKQAAITAILYTAAERIFATPENARYEKLWEAQEYTKLADVCSPLSGSPAAEIVV